MNTSYGGINMSDVNNFIIEKYIKIKMKVEFANKNTRSILEINSEKLDFRNFILNV